MEKKRKINNAFYDTLHHLWHHGTDHPVALLRAENAKRNPWISQILSKRFHKKCKILDIGCGGGLLTNHLALQGHHVHGIDLSSSSLNIAKKYDQTKSVTYLLANGYQLPYPDASFDVITAMDLLEHVEEPEKIIQEASRVLKKDGLFFFHTFNRSLFAWFYIIKGVEWFVKGTPKHMHLLRLFIKPKELSEMCKTHQLKPEKYIGLVPNARQWAFWKMVLTRRISPHFSFTFTPSLTTGYCGYARKITPNDSIEESRKR